MPGIKPKEKIKKEIQKQLSTLNKEERRKMLSDLYWQDVKKRGKIFDVTFKELFRLSKRPIIDFINAATNSHYTYNAKVKLENTEFITPFGGLLRPDAIISVEENNTVSYYHFEAQMDYDKTIALRIFHYGLYHSLSELNGVQNGHEMVYRFPDYQAVVYLERCEAKSKVTFIFSEDKELVFEPKTIKLWDYSSDTLKENGMYLLLPLKLIELKKACESSRGNKEKLTELRDEIKETTIKINLHIKALQDEGVIDKQDTDKMYGLLMNLNDYMFRNYMENEGVELKEAREELDVMARSLYNDVFLVGKAEGKTEGKAEGKVEGKAEGLLSVAYNLLKMNFTKLDIIKATSLSEKEVNDICERFLREQQLASQ